MIELRPHHLLCTQGYSGKGYSDGFVENMTSVVNTLRGDEPVKIRLVFSTDTLCQPCPNKRGEGLCKSQDNVSRFDSKTIQYFNLEEKEYIYQDIVREINSQMTPEILKDICSGCGWYPISSCRKNICGS